MMKLSELLKKELVDLSDGSSLGSLRNAELAIDPERGCIEAIIIPQRRRLSALFRKEEDMMIPWKAIRKIGPKVVIVETREAEARD